MPDPVMGEGTILEVNDGVAAAFVAVADLTENLTPPAPEHPRIPRPRLSSTTFLQQVVSTVKQLGDAQLSYELSYANFSRMEALVGIEKSYRITYTDGTRLAFTATAFKNTPNPVSGQQIATATLQMTLTSLVTLSDQSP